MVFLFTKNEQKNFPSPPHNKCYYHANLIRPALAKTLNQDKVHTPDIGGVNNTNEFMVQFTENLKSLMDDDAMKQQYEN